jgi:hypothetical protein
MASCLEDRWQEAGKKYWAASRSSRSSFGGFWQALRHYRVFVFSILCHLAQYDEILTDILRMEALALQCLKKGPYNTFPEDALQTLINIGSLVEAPSLATMNLAALVRNAVSSKAFSLARDRFYREELDEDALIVKRKAQWASSSIFLRVLRAFEVAIRIPIDIDSLPNVGFQKALTTALRDRVSDPWPLLFMRRLRRWIPNASEEHLRRIITNTQVAFSILPQSIVFAWLRVVLNGLPTSARTQGGRSPCLLCRWVEGDCIEHLVQCPSLNDSLQRWLPLFATRLGPVYRHQALCLQFPASNLQLLREVVLFGDILYTVHTRIRHHSPSSPGDLAVARIRQLKVRHGLQSVQDKCPA